MYKLKSIARRSTALGAAFAVLATAVIPAAPAFADALNPLTDRSLTLSSSAPGWDYLDGSGNTTYAPPNSGANGQKVGNTFEFKVSTDTTVDPDGGGTLTADYMKAMSFQYCISPAGTCLAPGNNDWTSGVRNSDSASTSDLNVTLDTNQSEATLGTYVDTTASDGRPTSIPAAGSTGSNYVVYYRTSDNSTPTNESDDNWAQSTGWTMTAVNHETGTEAAETATGAFNEIRLTHDGEGFAAGTMVRVVFFATNNNYITNPGSGAFFVRLNTFNDVDFQEADIIDGGVTVANVMNLGIQIVTKVLETMDFSVGVVDPYTLEATGSAGSQLQLGTGGAANTHNICEPILKRMTSAGTEQFNRLSLGDPSTEYSLSTANTYSTHSYFRLSSNSSAGATVYYSGNTLTNTVGDRINSIGDPEDDGTSTGVAAAPQVGSEQFGLALAVGNSAPYAIDYRTETKPGYVYENGADNAAAGLATYPTQGIHSSVEDNGISNVDANASWHQPRLASLVPEAQYANGAGYINSVYNNNVLTDSQFSGDGTSFAFRPESMLVPVPIASNDAQVVDCVTGKMRYIANIAATTPAGIYTTKLNYIAAPQY